MADNLADEIVRTRAEESIKALAAALARELAVNDAQARPGRRVRTALLIARDDDRFLAMNGSAHQMRECFVELFRRRPELRIVVQGALDTLFDVVSKWQDPPGRVSPPRGLIIRRQISSSVWKANKNTSPARARNDAGSTRAWSRARRTAGGAGASSRGNLRACITSRMNSTV